MRSRPQRRGWVIVGWLLASCARPDAGPTPATSAIQATGNVGEPTSLPREAASAPSEPAATYAPVPEREEAETPPAPPRIDIAEIDAVVARALAQGKMPGCVVAVGRSDGLVFTRAYGKRALVPRKREMTTDTIFDLASLTKPLVTASLVQRFVEQGRFDLDDKVARYIPEFSARGKGDATIRQLLLHTSGLPRVNPLREYEIENREASLAAIFATRPTARPGRRYLYSDLGYIALGALLERVSGESLQALSQRLLFEPLRMAETGYSPSASLRERIAPTEETDKRPTRLIHGEVHDPRAYRLGGVAGNAGVFSTARDLARFARMLLNGGELDGRRVLSRASVQELTRPQPAAGAIRTPGFDVDSDYSKPRGTLLSGRAFGHGGYTGTSLWVDPNRDLFVIFLSNRVHPDGKGNVIRLEGAITDAAARAVPARPAVCTRPADRVLPGIDVLARRGFAPLVGKRIGLVTHRAAVDAQGTPTLDVLAHAQGVTLGALFSPEHGLDSREEGAIADAHHDGSGVRVYSLFGRTRRPSATMLDGIDVLVVDLVDVGARFYTYMSTLHQVMLAGAEHGVPVMVLDRPNPIGGLAVEGPVLDADITTFVNYHPLPVRHGLTAGELAELLASERDIGVRLEIVETDGWHRGAFQDATGLPWRAPSPNLTTLQAALLYPALGLLESTNLSVGRGTDAPFRQIGAPFIDAAALHAAVSAREPAGVVIEPVEFTPVARPHRGEPCRGLRLRVSDAQSFAPVDLAFEVARALRRLYPERWKTDRLIRMVGSKRVVQGLLRGASLGRLHRSYAAQLAAFGETRARFLRYPTCEVTGAPGAPPGAPPSGHRSTDSSHSEP